MGHDHSHHHSVKEAKKGFLYLALATLTIFMIIEIVAGFLSHSVALLSDGAHMFSDVLSLALAIVASAWAGKKHKNYTFGRGGLETLSAQANGAALLILAGVLAVQAIERLISPEENIVWQSMIFIGILGAIINLIALIFLAKSGGESLNLKGAKAHMMGDLFGSFAAVFAGLLIAFWGWKWSDGVASLIVCLWMIKSGWTIFSQSSRILIGKSPRGINPEEIGRHIAAMPGVHEVHDLHVWTITEDKPSFSAHVVTSENFDCHMVQLGVQQMIKTQYGINHITLQMEHKSPLVLQIKDSIAPSK